MITRTADTDDDGTGGTGTVHNNAWKTAVYDALDGRWSEASTTLVGNQDNLAYAEADVLRCNNATTITLRGLLAPASPLKPGKRLIVVSVGAGTVVLNDQDVNSTAANRLITGTAAAVTLAAGTGFAWLAYDSVTARWRVVGTSVSAAGGPVNATTTSTGAQNDFAPSGITFVAGQTTVLRCNNASLLTIQGLAGGVDGAVLCIVSVGAAQVDLASQNVGSTAANRLINGVTGTVSLAAGGGIARFLYDGTTARWRLLDHQQGGWIAVAFAAGNFTASGAMTWTVDAGDQNAYAYLVDAAKKTMVLSVTLSTTTVGGTLANILNVKLPGGFTAARLQDTTISLSDNGVLTTGFAELSASGTVVQLLRADVANFTAATNNTGMRFTATFELQ